MSVVGIIDINRIIGVIITENLQNRFYVGCNWKEERIFSRQIRVGCEDVQLKE